MAVVKIYGDGLPTTASTTMYTGKTDKTCIIKSIILCNVNSVDTTVTMALNSSPINYLIYAKPMKANQTLVIPISDVVISPGETIRMWCSAPYVNARVTAEERDGAPLTLGLNSFRVSMPASSTPTTIVPALGSTSRLVKSLVLCNVTATAQTVTIRFGWSGDNCNLINKYTIAANDTILIPFADMIISSNEFIEGWCSASGAVHAHIVMEVVT
ncbi:hypothetical protein P9222_31285 [Paenibacillus amylolyticus]|nr:hypothetical protein [Paenibacillus amylolyticus]WFR62595.1 hypothetical protein P9222_31285 [Paenibacillus amylolyticus]